jgi:hypothetical protein
MRKIILVVIAAATTVMSSEPITTTESVYYEWRYNPNMGSSKIEIEEAFRAKVTAAMADGSLQGTHNILDGYDGYNTFDDYDYEGPKVIKMNVETDNKTALDAMLGVDAGKIALNTSVGEQVICPIDLADANNGYWICSSGDQCVPIADLCNEEGNAVCPDQSDLGLFAKCNIATTTATTQTGSATSTTRTASSKSATVVVTTSTLPITTPTPTIKKLRETFHLRDTNQDGFLTPEESGLSIDLFNVYDTNSDGKLSKAELNTPKQPRDTLIYFGMYGVLCVGFFVAGML